MKYLLIAVLFIGIGTTLSAQKERKFIRNGTSFYNDSNYIESEIEYKKALDKLDEGERSFEAEFNLGDSYFQQKKYEDALKQFQSIDTEKLNKEQKGALHHNIGNSYMAQQQPDLNNAIESYKTALRNNPADNETRYNLIAAMKMKQDQENEDENQDENEDQEDQQDQQDQQNQDQNQDQQDQEQDQQDQQQNQDQQQQQQENQISEEDAQRILESLNQDEQQLQEEMQKIEDSAPVNIEKNW
ncbi:tetratricopeptide repeat protein [Saccharicrinis aurantiacus]|uniref:tetratricopeptide repeat protein n=1 Tax=Saccharicrinis aurantiacus TaxID=1849719 RepID=UPI000839A4D2|nr:tetratricopeptide repeat protein [Saccharicrinis aurantiacus]